MELEAQLIQSICDIYHNKNSYDEIMTFQTNHDVRFLAYKQQEQENKSIRSFWEKKNEADGGDEPNFASVKNIQQ